jgi:hypothetical protein
MLRELNDVWELHDGRLSTWQYRRCSGTKRETVDALKL